MARQNCLKSIKQKIIVILTVLCLLFISAFAFTACADEKSFNDGNYSNVLEDESDIYNDDFTYSAKNVLINTTSFPLTSPYGWTRNTDNSTASNVDSGVVSVKDSAWETLINKLYDDADFLSYVRHVDSSLTKANVITAIATENGYTDESVVTDDEIKLYTTTKILQGDFKNPLKHSNAQDDYVYMLNNYTANLGFGTAQKVTSSATVMLEANKTYKISVWVKTINVTGQDQANKDYGATIRLVNNLNSVGQAEYRLEQIKDTSNTENNGWTQYSIYVETDQFLSSSFQLVLGLGIGNNKVANMNYYTEGTVLFDDITFEEVESTPATITADQTASVSYGSTKVNEIAVGDKTEFKYVLKFSDTENSFMPCTSYSDGLTKSHIISSGKELDSTVLFPNANTGYTYENVEGVHKFNLTKTSITLELTESAFKLKQQESAIVYFDIKANLNKLYSNNLSINVVDTLGANTVTRAKVATLENKGEWTRVYLVIKNNFNLETDSERSFELQLVIGPEDVASCQFLSEMAYGTVELKNFNYLIKKFDLDDTESVPYKLYKFYETNAKATVALYAGYNADYENVSSDGTEYTFKTLPSDMGSITSSPTSTSEFTGVVADHVYVKQGGNEVAVNDRIGGGNSDGSIAGVINTRYISNYNEGIQTALNGAYKTDENIQPLVIYNAVEDCYGFVGKEGAIATSAHAKISVTLRVVGANAKAYVYLVDTSSEGKSVMNFIDFTVNTNIVNSVAKGTNVTAEENSFIFTVTEDMMNNDGWVTVDFMISTGNDGKDYRVEVWNGDRTGTVKSQGYVFVKDVTTSGSSFTLPDRYADTFTSVDSPLFNFDRTNSNNKLYAYVRELTDLEISFNKKYADQAIEYTPTYVWAQNEKLIYASYATIEVEDYDPFDSIVEEEGSGCTAETDPSTFWLSFSSILLAVVLILAIIIVFIKQIRRRRKYYSHDKRENFKISTKQSAHKRNQEKKKQVEEELGDEENEEVAPENVDLDDYVYGDVENFGENKPAETENSDSEKTE